MASSAYIDSTGRMHAALLAVLAQYVTMYVCCNYLQKVLHVLVNYCIVLLSVLTS